VIKNKSSSTKESNIISKFGRLLQYDKKSNSLITEFFETLLQDIANLNQPSEMETFFITAIKIYKELQDREFVT